MKIKFTKGRRLEGNHVAPGEVAEIDDNLAMAFINSGAACEYIERRGRPKKEKNERDIREDKPKDN